MTQADFTAWSLYTGPSQCKNLFADGSSPWVVGQWDGINTDTGEVELKKDLDYRIDVVLHAFKAMLPRFKTNDRHFVIPEFFFRCKQGPYPYRKVDGVNYPFEYIVSTLKNKLKGCIKPEDHNNYTIIIGSALTSNVVDYDSFLNSPEVMARQKELNEYLPDIYLTIEEHDNLHWSRDPHSKKDSKLYVFMERARRNPLCIVRNRGAYFHFNRTLMDEVEVFCYEKQNESSIDLTMGMIIDKKITANGMITEWMASYPSFSIVGGDKQTEPFFVGARFSPSGFIAGDVGVEICRDHYFQRLRRTVGMTIDNGANAHNFPLAKQFVVSGGAQIFEPAIAINCNSVIFNADGLHNVGGVEDKGTAEGVYSQFIDSNWTGRDEKPYHSHSQIAFTTNDSIIKGYNNADGDYNVKALTNNGKDMSRYNEMTDSIRPVIIEHIGPVIPDQDPQNIFALNDGELHHYAPK